MDKKLQDLISRTNLDELIAAPITQVDLNQPVETARPNKTEQMRSTSDPLQINFAAADVVGKFQDARTSAWLKGFALIFLGGPMIVSGLLLLYLIWFDPQLGTFKLPDTPGAAVRALVSSACALAIGGFWPYIVFCRRRSAPHRG